MPYLMPKVPNFPSDELISQQTALGLPLPLRKAFWASWVMASASSRITSLKPFLGKQVAPSQDFSHRTSASRSEPTSSHLYHQALFQSPFLPERWPERTSVVTQRGCPHHSSNPWREPRSRSWHLHLSSTVPCCWALHPHSRLSLYLFVNPHPRIFPH